MQEEIRRLKVKEFNRILPMLRETAKTDYSNLSEMWQRQRRQRELQEVEEAIKRFDDFFYSFGSSMDEDTKRTLQQLIDKEKKRRIELEISINASKKIEENLSERWKFEADLYLVITSTISTEGVFIETSEIQEEFLKEYIYLLVLGNKYGYNKIKMERIFVSPSDFYEMVRRNFSTDQAKILESLEERNANQEMFFELFG